MSGQLSFIPTSLPPGLYEQASGGGIVSHGTGSSSSYNTGSFSPTRVAQQYTGPGALQAQATGQKRVPPVLPSRKPSAPIQTSSVFSNAATPFPTGQLSWDVTTAEKASADRFFDTLDSQKLGYIEGDVAVPFMLQSNLPEDILAQVWYVFGACSGLCDIHST
jgi:epidermal growth factor receptor substrate 15